MEMLSGSVVHCSSWYLSQLIVVSGVKGQVA